MVNLPRKVLIGISLAVSYLLTVLLSFYLTPPIPDFSKMVTVFNNIRRLPAITINFPRLFKFPQLTENPSNQTSQTNPVLTQKKQPTSTQNNGLFNLFPTIKPNQPTSDQNNFPSVTNGPTSYHPTQPTTNHYPSPTNTPLQPTNPPSKPSPTSTPKPTNTPKPTKTPTPTPIKLQPLRPGKNFQDVAKILEPIICIPQAMLMATVTEEYGPWMGNVQADWTNRNTYRGSDPHDVVGSAAIPSDVVIQMMEDTWHKIKPYVSAKLGNAPLSLDVTFDAMAGGGYHLRNVSLAMQDHVACNDWPVKYILYGACRYNGACAPGATTYNQYSYDVCNLYNQFTTGPKKNCH